MLRCSLCTALFLTLVAARPAASVLTDDEPSNDSIGTAAVQIVPTAEVTTDGGTFTLFAGDIDYLGIGNLGVGDIVTVSTTPLDDVAFEDPDTFIGLFSSGGSSECEGDDTVNNELGSPASAGFGSLCRFVIDSAGTWFVGVTGSGDPPFNGIHFQNGVYELHVTINTLDPSAGAEITDAEPANDSVATAPLQVIKTGPVTTAGGELVLVAGDIDFVGIAALSTGDVVTVTTTPLDDADLEVPDTIVGLFDSSTTDPTHMILCRDEDAPNNDLIKSGGGRRRGYSDVARSAASGSLRPATTTWE